MEVFTWAHLVYWGLLAVVIFAEAASFGVLWEKREAYRWTMGYFTVFLMGIPLVWFGWWDETTWLGLFFGVGIAGAIKTGYEQTRKSREAKRLLKEGANRGQTYWKR